MMLGLQLLPAQNTHTPYLTPYEMRARALGTRPTVHVVQTRQETPREDPCYLCALQRTQALRERARAGPLT